ncbi:MAG: hypothetical protein AD073_000030 [Mycoplasmataceae bacterium]|nr:MAG: hypothetical protein AD073_000030 [Mycoplasmataceae bacterium]
MNNIKIINKKKFSLKKIFENKFYLSFISLRILNFFYFLYISNEFTESIVNETINGKTNSTIYPNLSYLLRNYSSITISLVFNQFFIFAIFSTILEEFICCYLIRRIFKKINPWIWKTISLFFFIISHGGFIPAHIPLALITIYSYEKSNNLKYPIFFHFFNNLLSIFQDFIIFRLILSIIKKKQ